MKAIDQEVSKLNEMVAGEGPYTFDINTIGKDFPLNLTMTSAPAIKKDSKLIRVFFDGLFDIPEGQNVTTKFVVKENSVWPPRFNHSHSEQFIIHESMLNSFIKVADNSMFPYVFDDQNITSQIVYAFPELAKHYGKDVKVNLGLSMMENNTDSPIHLNKTLGIVIGNQETFFTKIELICSNATTFNESAVKFSMKMEARANLTMTNFIFYPHVD